MSDKSKRITELEAEVEALRGQLDEAHKCLKESLVELKDAQLDMMHMRRSLKICQQG